MLDYSRINRIRLEFKVHSVFRQMSVRHSINRIRLEFKGYDYATVQAEVNRINRIRLEFKVPSPKPELTTLLPY